MHYQEVPRIPTKLGPAAFEACESRMSCIFPRKGRNTFSWKPSSNKEDDPIERFSSSIYDSTIGTFIPRLINKVERGAGGKCNALFVVIPSQWHGDSAFIHNLHPSCLSIEEASQFITRCDHMNMRRSISFLNWPGRWKVQLPLPNGDSRLQNSHGRRQVGREFTFRYHCITSAD